jgi:adenylyltransferase/sulfurtransferase
VSPLPLNRPRLPGHVRILVDPPNDAGEEGIVFFAESRRVELRGHSFREFERRVVPLLDGRHGLDAIAERVSDCFARPDLEAALAVLAEQRLVEEGASALPPTREACLAPQLGMLFELGADPAAVVERLAERVVAVVGAGGIGAVAAQQLAGAGTGVLRLVDPDVVHDADGYLAPPLKGAKPGVPRAEALASALGDEARVAAFTGPFTDDRHVADAVAGADLVLSCLDAGQISLAYRLNRVCLAARIPMIAASASAFEVVVGPGVKRDDTACFLCFQMRQVACADDPERAFDIEAYRDRRRRDDSGARENTAMAVGAGAGLLALEAFKELTGVAPSGVFGRVLILDLMSFTLTKHVVLKKPWCPACDPRAPSDGQRRG